MRTHRALVAFLCAALACAGCARQENAAQEPGTPDSSAIIAEVPMPAPSGDTLLVIDWARARAENRIYSGEVVPPGRGQPFTSLRVENTRARLRNFIVAVIDDPGITEPAWVLVGQVSYTGLSGKGYLELQNRFPDGEVHFARTMGSSGPTRMLQGTEPWRPFALVFRAFKPHRPSQLVVTVMLPGEGLVELGPLTLRQGAEAVNESLAAR